MSVECYSSFYPKARVEHKCDECGGHIRKGVVYFKQTGISEGRPYTWKVHKDCADLYFQMNQDSGSCVDDQMPLSDFDLDEIQVHRGYFPHAVCRIEFIRDRHKRGAA